MSSHHIIRDEQEPALLFWEGFDTPMEYWHPLLEWSPMVWVHQQATQLFWDYTIKVDTIIGKELVHPAALSLMENQFPINHLALANLMDVLTSLLENKQKAVNIFISEYSLAQVLSQVKPMVEAMDMVVFHKHGRTLLVKSGKFEKWVTGGKSFKILNERYSYGGDLIEIEANYLKTKKEGIISFCCEDSPLITTEYW
jgi:thiamine pyrophosphokinase